MSNIIGRVLASVIALAATFSTASLSAAAEDSTGPRHPNVVFVLCDDLRWDSLGCAGHPQVKTPHVDHLASEGVRFSNAFCTTSLCSPSRASILSGLYAHRHGVVNNFTEFPTSIDSLPRALQRGGYETAYIGKWHMGEDNDEKRPGFDYFASHKGQGKYFDTEFNVDGERRTLAGYYTTAVTELALDWLRRDRKKPFFLMIGQKAPHSFYTPEPKYAHTFDDVKIEYPASAFQLTDKPDWIKARLSTWHGIYGPLFEWRKKFPDESPAAVRDFAAMQRAYWGTILSVDDSVGRLVAELKRQGVYDDTIFVFMGDNGLLAGEHGMVDKRTMHEPSIRIPLIVRYPGLVPATKPVVEESQVLTLDMAPSLLELCGAPALPKTDGRSWVSLVRSPAEGGGDAKSPARDWRTAWLYEYNYEKQFPYTPNIRGVRTARWKYMHYPHGDGGPDRHKAELYDLQVDPGELHNLIDDSQHAVVLKDLREKLANQLRATGVDQDRMPLDEGVKQQLPDQKIR